MSFEVLSELQLADAPADGVRTLISDLTVAAVENVDADGGRLDILSTDNGDTIGL